MLPSLESRGDLRLEGVGVGFRQRASHVEAAQRRRGASLDHKSKIPTTTQPPNTHVDTAPAPVSSCRPSSRGPCNLHHGIASYESADSSVVSIARRPSLAKVPNLAGKSTRLWRSRCPNRQET